MKWFSRKTAQPEQKGAQFEDVLMRLIAAHSGGLEYVTPENCMQSPTVQAIVTAISRRVAVSPVHVYRTKIEHGLESKEKLPNHPVAKLLRYPNEYQSRYDYWQDAASAFIRHGKFLAVKARGKTGPIRRLYPIKPSEVNIRQDQDTLKVTYWHGQRDYSPDKIHYVRGPARNFFDGNSPVDDIRRSIALEIEAEKYGTTFFSNGAVPLLVLKYVTGAKGFKTPEDEKAFIEDFQKAFGGDKRHRALMLPIGMDLSDVKIENEKAQFLETRKYQRTVIAGAFGVPPHLVGDLERATFNNVEQQDKDFTSNVVQPIAEAFESAMERDFLTDEDWNSGIRIRFNLDSNLRADFKSRQEGLEIQMRNGVINSNQWREIEKMNPISKKDGGHQHYHSANIVPVGQEVSDEPDISEDSPPDQGA